MFLQGKVINGQRIANKFGVATANIDLDEARLEENGVYAAEVSLVGESQKIQGVMHYGKRKTTDNEFSVEIHLFDFSRDIYGETLEINVLKKLRNIQKFSEIQELFAQIKKDIIQAKKVFLRRKIKSIWKYLPLKPREILAKKAVEKVSQNEGFLKTQNIYIYAPKNDEIDFVAELCEKFAHKNYFFPKIMENEMKFFPAKLADLEKGKWGILEPIETREFLPQKDDLIFVPAIGADLSGNRIGNGGGFYDKFLAGNPAKKICVLPDFAIFPEIPVEEHDFAVDEVVVI